MEIELPGAHSNLGGGYGEGLEQLGLAIARRVLVREGFAVLEQKKRSQSILNMGRNNSDWVGTAAANAILDMIGQSGRGRIEPKATAGPKDDYASAENFVQALIERSVREIKAGKAELERIQSANRQGKPIIFDGLSIQLDAKDGNLVLKTNCPDSVSFDTRSRWLFLDGSPYTRLTEKAVDDAKAGGLIMIIDRQDAADFKSADQL